MKRRSSESEELAARICAWHDSHFIAGKASRYIHTFDELKSGDLVYLVCRKSGRERPEVLKKQVANLHRVVKASGGIVVGYREYAGSGLDPSWLTSAVAKAKRLGACWLLAETTDRLVRNKHFHTEKFPDVQATDEELRNMAEEAKGIPLMTHLHPDASPSEVRSYQRKRGGGGRPRKRYTRRSDLPKAVRMKMRQLKADGLTIREIAAGVHWSKSSVQRYLERIPQKWIHKLRRPR